MRDDADIVDDDVGDGFGDGSGGSVTSTGSVELSRPWLVGCVARSCQDRGLLVALEEETLPFSLVIAAAVSLLLSHYCFIADICC